MKAIEFPEDAEQGQGKLDMRDANSDLIQRQLSELVLHVVHTIQACNEAKEVLEDEFESVRANIEIIDTRVHTDRHSVTADVAGVGTQLQLQQAVLQEL